MSDLTEATAALITATGELVGTKAELLDWSVGSSTGGPNGNGTYPFTEADGTVIFVPSIAKLKEIALGGANAETLAEVLGTANTKLALVDTATQQANEKAAYAGQQGDYAKEQALAIGDVSAAVARAEMAAGNATATVAANATAIGLLQQSSTQTIGRPVTPVDSTAGATANTRFVARDPVAVAGPLGSVKFWARAAGNITLYKYSLSGNAWTQTAVSPAIAVAGAGLVTLTVADYGAAFGTLAAGEYLAFSTSIAMVAYSSTAGSDGAGWGQQPSASGLNVLAGFRFEFAFAANVQTQTVTAAALQAIKTTADAGKATADATKATSDANAAAVALLSQSSVTQTIGRTVDPISGSSAGANTYVWLDPVAAAGALTQVKVFALAAGTVTLGRYSVAGSVATRIATSAALTVVPGLNTLAISNFPVSAGDRLAIAPSAAGVLAYNSAAADGAGWAQTSGGAPAIGNLGSTVINQRIEVGFSISTAQQTVTAAALASAKTDAATALAKATSHDTAVGALSAVVPQTIGRPTTAALATGSAVAGSTYCAADPVKNTGTLVSLDLFALATGTITISRFSLAGNVLTLVASQTANVAATGATSVVLNMAVQAGEYLAVRGAGIFAYSTGSQDSLYYLNVSSGTATSPTANYLFQLRYNLTATVQVVNAPDFQAVKDQAAANAAAIAASGVAGTLSLANVDKIVPVINSYGEAAGTLLGKSPAMIASALSEYNWGNFAQGGQTAGQLATQIAQGTPHFGATFDKHRAKYALISENQNGKITNGQSDATYYAQQQALIDTVRAFGATPILASEWGVGTPPSSSYGPLVDGEARNVRGLRALADANGCLFIDVTSKSRTMNPSIFNAFWKSAHPGTRMGYLIADGWLRGLKALPRPLRSMKIFRARGTVTIGSTADLLFRSMDERHRLFRELNVGQMALSETEKLNYDAATSLYAGNQTQADEYIALLGGTATNLGTYALIDCVLPVTKATGVTVTLSDLSATVYARKMTATGPSWVALTLTNGAFVVPDAAGLIDRDRLTLLVYKSGGLSLNASPVVTWSGGVARIPIDPSVPTAPKGAELLAQPLTVVAGAVPAAWANSGALAPAVLGDGAAYLPGANQAPPLTTGAVEVTSTAGLAQAFTVNASDDAQEVVIRVWARRWVPIFSGSDFSTAPITYETCDTATLKVTISGASGNAYALRTAQVGLAWTEIELRTTMEAYTTAATIDVRSADANIQIAKVSARVA